MNRDAKNISSSLRPQIEVVKGNIRASGGRWFDADGYVGKTAIKELRAGGWAIEYDRDRGSYRTVMKQTSVTESISRVIQHLVEAKQVRGIGEEVLAYAKEKLPFATAGIDDSGSGLMDGVTFRLSLQPKEEWSNGIFQNSPYAIISVSEKGRRYDTGFGPYEAKLSSSGVGTRFIKKTGRPDQVIAHLKRFIDSMSADLTSP